MGEFFVEAKDTVRINFPDGQWVDIKEEMTQEDEDYITNQMAIAEVQERDAHWALNLGKVAMLERNIISWSFHNGDSPVPVNRSNVSALRKRYREKVLKEIDRVNKEAESFVIKNPKRVSTTKSTKP